MTFDCFFLENNLKFRIKKKLLAPMGGHDDTAQIKTK